MKDAHTRIYTREFADTNLGQLTFTVANYVREQAIRGDIVTAEWHYEESTRAWGASVTISYTKN